MEPKTRRLVGWLGIGFVVIFLVSSFIVPNTPNSHKNAAKVVSFYRDHKGGFAADAWIIMVAIVVGLFFFWWLRDYLANDDANRRLASIGFSGAVLFAVSGGLAAGLNFALADSADHSNLHGFLPLFNVLQNDFTVFMAGAGVATFLIATGLVCLRGSALPKWLGWVGLVLALVSLVLPFFGPPAAGLFVLITSIVILVRARREASAAAA